MMVGDWGQSPGFTGYQQEGIDRCASAVASFAITSMFLIMMASIASQAMVAPRQDQALAMLDLASVGGPSAASANAKASQSGAIGAMTPLGAGSSDRAEQNNRQILAPSALASELDPHAAKPKPTEQASDGAPPAASAPSVIASPQAPTASNQGQSEGLTGYDPRAFAGTPPLYLALQRAAEGEGGLLARHPRLGALMQVLAPLNDSLVARGLALRLAIVIDGSGKVVQVKRPLLFSDNDAAQAEALVGLAVADASAAAVSTVSVELGRLA